MAQTLEKVLDQELTKLPQPEVFVATANPRASTGAAPAAKKIFRASRGESEGDEIRRARRIYNLFSTTKKCLKHKTKFVCSLLSNLRTHVTFFFSLQLHLLATSLTRRPLHHSRRRHR
jgi:hypothetical protein